MIVTIQHLRTVPGYSVRGGFCLTHSRSWFHRHGLDWRAFVRHGIDAAALAATGDAMAAALVAHAQQQGNGRGR